MFMLGAHTNSTKLQDPCTQVLSFRCQSGASHTPVTGIHLPALEAQHESEYQQKNIAGDFGKKNWAATHTVSCVAHSTNARSLQVVPRCKGDYCKIQYQLALLKGRNKIGRAS